MFRILCKGTRMISDKLLENSVLMNYTSRHFVIQHLTILLTNKAFLVVKCVYKSLKGREIQDNHKVLICGRIH